MIWISKQEYLLFLKLCQLLEIEEYKKLWTCLI